MTGPSLDCVRNSVKVHGESGKKVGPQKETYLSDTDLFLYDAVSQEKVKRGVLHVWLSVSI